MTIGSTKLLTHANAMLCSLDLQGLLLRRQLEIVARDAVAQAVYDS
jgi:hypothetical protein